MSTGWIKLHRQLLKWEWYDDINVMRLFLHCLLRVNHKPKKWRGIDIERGQFYTSLDSLSVETGLTLMQLRTCFSKLQTTGEITSSGMARGRMITVVQYDLYQDDNKLNNSLVTGFQQGSNRVATTNKNVNNEKNEKKSNWLAPGGLNIDAWNDFVEHRKTMKKPLSDIAKTKSSNILKDLDKTVQQETVDKSIQAGWAGLFPEKQNLIPSQNLQPKQKREMPKAGTEE